MKYLLWMPLFGLIPFVLAIELSVHEKELLCWHAFTVVILCTL